MTCAELAVLQNTGRPRHRRGRKTLLWLLLAALIAAPALRYGGRAALPEELRRYAAAHGVDPGAYPKQLVELYERNPETRDFVFHYPQEREALAELTLRQEAGSGEVPLLMQWDERWGYGWYAGDFFGLTGCGPTCLSMVALYLTGDPAMTPEQIGAFAAEHGYAVDGSGTAWALFTEGAEALGMTSRELPLMEGAIVESLEAGQPVVCILGPGDFTTTGHFIVLTGLEDGAFQVHDPNSRQRSETRWTYDQLAGQIQCLWAFS